MRTYLKYPKKEKQRKPKQRTRDWCPGGGKVLEVHNISDPAWINECQRKVETIRCPACDKKMEIFNYESDWDLVRRIPKHKAF